MFNLEKICKGDITIILVTHRVEVITDNFDRIILLKEGRIYDDGRIEETITSKNMTKLFETEIELVKANGFLQVLPGNSPGFLEKNNNQKES